jgi:phosphopantothenoylcysteine synthetase/decarboxylase
MNNTPKKLQEEAREQTALPFKYANDMIALNAVRTGGKGYEGEENLVEWLEKSLESKDKFWQEGVDAACLQGRIDEAENCRGSVVDNHPSLRHFVRRLQTLTNKQP